MSSPPVPPVESDSRLWLALPPVWTGAAVLRTAFPTPTPASPSNRDASLIRFVDRAIAVGTAACRGGMTAARFPYATFWLTDEARAAVLTASIKQYGRRPVQTVAQQIARELCELDREDPVPPVVRDWIALVTGELQLAGRVLELCHDGRVDQAMRLVTAAEVYLPIAAPALADQVAGAHRQVTLANRHSHDLESLKHFQNRPRWAKEVDRLLSVPDGTDSWALHLLGRGGTGKTTFIRYLASGRYARDRDRGTLPIARVDFDHLNPEYPLRRPVQLLVEFAEELAPYVAESGDGMTALDAFMSIAKSAEATGSGSTGDHLVDQATKAFARFVAALRQPVLLILDTCEELARQALTDGPNPAVQAMFDRLRQVQALVRKLVPEEVCTVRVLLSGRRPLGVDEQGLKVLEVRGFREPEAVELLKRPYEGEVMSARLRRIVLVLSPERGPVLSPGADSDQAPRYSPYDLAMYWRWWTADTSIKPADLRQNRRSDYIDARIVPRLGPHLRRWLPAVALLGRFDVRMLAPANPDVRDPDAIVREFAQLEWTDTDTDSASRSPIVEVDRPLLPLLLAWARDTDRHRFDETRARLATALVDDLRLRPLGQLSTAHVISALRLSDRDAALEIWEEIEHRAAREDGWGWLASVGPRVLGSTDEVPDGTRPDARDGITGNGLLAAAVEATAISLTRRDDPDRSLAAAWSRVASTVGRANHPVAARLRWRAWIAQARYNAAPRSAVDVAELARLVTDAEPHGPRLAAGVVALVETLVENRRPGVDLAPVAEAARDWLKIAEDPVVRAALRIYLSLLARSGEQPAAAVLPAEDLSPSRAAAEARAAQPGDGHWPDWTPPSHCGAWVSLHVARDAFLAGRPLESLPLVEWERQAEKTLHLIDGERLMSQCLRLRMGYGVVPRDRLDSIRARDRHDPARVANRAVHHEVPPLFATLSEAYTAAGSADVALRIVRDRRGEAATDRQRRRAIHEADRALVRLSRTLRDRRIAPVFRYRTVPEDEAFRAEVWATNALVDGSRPDDWGDGRDLHRWHDCWQATAVDARTGRVALPVAPVLPDDATPANLRSMLIADGREMQACGPDQAELIAWANRWSDQALKFDRAETGWPLAPLQVWLATASDEALAGPRDIDAPFNAPLHEASFALRLGELRALRDPRGALPLLKFVVEQSGRRSPVLTLQAATVRALATLHLPGPPDMVRQTEVALALADAYDAFRSHVAPQPPRWQEVADTDRPLPGPWHGWLTRVRIAAQGLVPSPAADLALVARPQPRFDVPVELFGDSYGRFGPEAEPGPTPALGDGVLAHGRTLLSRWLRAGAIWLRTHASRERSGSPRVTLEVDDGAHALLVSHDHLLPPGSPEAPLARVPVAWSGEDLKNLPDGLWPVLHERPYDVGRLRLPPRLARLAWEEYLERPAGHRPGEPPTAWYREWPKASAARPGDWRPGRADVVPADRCRGLAEETYAARPGARLIYDRSLPAVDPPASVLHVVGRPVFDPTGPLLQTAERANRRTPTEDSFVSSDDLASHRAHFVVVQGLPHQGSLRIDPFEASVARQFAVDAMVTGVGSLLLIPALPHELARAVFQKIRDVADRDTMPSHADRVGLVQQIHKLILERFRDAAGGTRTEPARNEMWQVLGQVILFLPASEVGVEQGDEVVPADVDQ